MLQISTPVSILEDIKLTHYEPARSILHATWFHPPPHYSLLDSSRSLSVKIIKRSNVTSLFHPLCDLMCYFDRFLNEICGISMVYFDGRNILFPVPIMFVIGNCIHVNRMFILGIYYSSINYLRFTLINAQSKMYRKSSLISGCNLLTGCHIHQMNAKQIRLICQKILVESAFIYSERSPN